MKPFHLLLLTLIHAVACIRIIQSNDDGWAELAARALNDALREAGHDVILSAPAEDKSHASSSDEPPSRRTKPCQYNSCPANSGPVGYNHSRPDLNWVNSYPVSAMKYGIDMVAPRLWNGSKPELAISGINIGTNLFLQNLFGGTIGAAAFAAHKRRIPAISFSVGNNKKRRWDVSPVPEQTQMFVRLAMILINQLIKGGKPYLPDGVYLNVNIPKMSYKHCWQTDHFEWVLSRVYFGPFSDWDVSWCHENRLPMEWDVWNQGVCYIPVSIADASDKTTMNDIKKQWIVLQSLKPLLSCVPDKYRHIWADTDMTREDVEEIA